MVNLETLQDKYADEIQRYASDREVCMYTHMPYPYPEGGAIEFIERSIKKCADGNFINFAITFDGKFAGIISLTIISDSNMNNVAELAYWVGKPLWNKGITTEAVKLILQYGFERMDLKKVIARCLERNIGSYRVMEKNNFKFIDKKPNDELSQWDNNEYILKYELLKKDWVI